MKARADLTILLTIEQEDIGYFGEDEVIFTELVEEYLRQVNEDISNAIGIEANDIEFDIVGESDKIDIDEDYQ